MEDFQDGGSLSPLTRRPLPFNAKATRLAADRIRRQPMQGHLARSLPVSPGLSVIVVFRR